MLHAKLGEKEFDMKTSWGEITVKEFTELMKSENTGSVTAQLSVITGLTKEEIQSANSIDIEKLLLHTEFLNTLPDLEKIKKTIPEAIRIGDKTLPVIKDLTLEPWGCKEVLYTEMIRCVQVDGHLMNCVAYAIATYFYKAYHGKDFDPAKMDEIIKAAEQCSFIEVFPVANFFLNKSKKYILTNGQNLKQNMNPMRSQQESVN